MQLWEGEFVSESKLASTIGHEIEVHLDTQVISRGEGYGQTAEGEVEAFDYNIKNAQRFGNTPEEVEEFERNRDAWAAESAASSNGNEDSPPKETPLREREE